MKKIKLLLSFLLLLLAVNSFGQGSDIFSPPGRAWKLGGQASDLNFAPGWLHADSAFILPFHPATSPYCSPAGSMYFNLYGDSLLYFNNGLGWHPFGTGISLINTGYGLLGGPITTTGTIRSDTTKVIPWSDTGRVITTKHYVDSIAAVGGTPYTPGYAINLVGHRFDLDTGKALIFTDTLAGRAIETQYHASHTYLTGIANFWGTIIHGGDSVQVDTTKLPSRHYVDSSAAAATGTPYTPGYAMNLVGHRFDLDSGKVVNWTDSLPGNRWFVTPTYLASFGYKTGTVTGVTAGIGLSATPNPIINTGTIIIDSGYVWTKRQVDSAILSYGYISTIAGITAGGDLTGTYVNPTIGANKVTYNKMQQASALTLLGNPTGSLANLQEITLGLGLSFSGSTLVATGSGGTVTSFSAGNLSPLFTTTVGTPTTTPSLAFSLTNAPGHSFFGNFTGSTGPPSYSSPLLASPDFANQGTTSTLLHGNASGNPSFGSVVTADIQNNAVTYGKMQQASAMTLIGNPTGSLANLQEITLGLGLSFSGGTLVASGSGGTVTSVAAASTDLSVTGSPITTSGTITLNLLIDRFRNPNITSIKTSNYSAAANEFVRCDNTGGSFTVTLPTAPADKSVIAVKTVIQSGTNTISLVTGGSDAFNLAGGGTTLTVRYLNQAFLIQYNAADHVYLVMADDITKATLDALYLAIGATAGGDLTGTYPNPTLNPSSNIGWNNHKITSLTDPTSAQDAATKNYVDNAVAGANPQVNVQVSTTAGLPAYTYSNGVGGIGATITITTPAIFTSDGYTPALNDRVLIKDETTTNRPYNGVYTITTLGTALISTVFTRATDYNQPTDINNTTVGVVNGTLNGGSAWIQTATVTTVGTSNIIFSIFTPPIAKVIEGITINTPGVIFTTPVTSTTAANIASLTLVFATQSAWTIFGNNSNTTGTPTFFNPVLASGLFNSQGTSTTLLHGNASGNPSWTQVQTADVANNAITYGKLQAASTNSLLIGSPSGSSVLGEISIGTGLTMTGSVLSSSGSGVSSVTGTAPIVSSGGPTPAISFQNIASGTVPANTTGSVAPPANSLRFGITPNSSMLAEEDTNKNVAANSFITLATKVITSASTYTVTVSSSHKLDFTGTTAGQIIQMPVVSGLQDHQPWWIRNFSTQTITINASGGAGNTIISLGSGATVELEDSIQTGTTNASWLALTQNNNTVVGGNCVNCGVSKVLYSDPSGNVATSTKLTFDGTTFKWNGFSPEMIIASTCPVTAPSVTGTTNETTLGVDTIVAGTMVGGDQLEINSTWRWTGGANTKTNRIYLSSNSGTPGTTYSSGGTTFFGITNALGSLSEKSLIVIGWPTTASQVAVGVVVSTGSGSGFGASTQDVTTTTLNNSSNVYINYTTQQANTGDAGFLIMHSVKDIRATK